jgi:O-antigen/teichoic acid export membrane protein
MGTDYYPRLCEVSNDDLRSKAIINQQAEVTVLILAPVLVFFFVFSKLGVIILYSESFLAITDMMLWAALGMFFKASTWPMGFLFLAKGNSKMYFWNELISNVYNLSLSIIGYKLFGLTGLGMAFFLSYLLTLMQVMLIMKMRYDFFYGIKFIQIFSYQFAIAIITFILMLKLTSSVKYFFCFILFCISLWISYIELDKRIGLKYLIKNLKKL